MAISNNRISFAPEPHPRRGKRVPVPAKRLELRQARTVRLVVVESGAHRFDSYVAPDGLDETMVVAQTAGESVPELVLRIGRAMKAIERSGRQLGQSIVVAAPRGDAAAAESRILIGRALLARSESVSGRMSELFFMAERSEPKLAHELMALVEALVGESGGDRVPIRLRFVETDTATRGERPSGVYPRLRSAAAEHKHPLQRGAFDAPSALVSNGYRR
jgi:hypothetical protein